MIDVQVGLGLLNGGVSVLPIGNNKRPYGPRLPNRQWKPYQSQPPTAAEVSGWAGAKGVMGFAAIGGKVSGGLLMIDFDAEGFYEKWKESVGALADGLPVQRTGGGCYQVWLRCEEPGGNQKLAFIPDSTQRDGRAIAIETRGEGGYAVAPGSIHPNGKTYESISGDFTAIPKVTMDIVRTLLAAAASLDQCPLTSGQLAKAEAAEPRYAGKVPAYLRPNGKPLGVGQARPSVIDAYNAAHSIHESLASRGYERRGERYIRPGHERFSAPGVTIFDGHKSFHHSSNDPLNNGHCHDSFSIFCELDHGGDVGRAVKAAAKELGLDGSHWPDATLVPEKIDDDPAHGRHQTWFDLDLSLNHNGGPHVNLDNACRVLSRHASLTGKIWYDEFHERIFSTIRGPREEWSDDLDLWVQCFVQRELGLSGMGVDAVRGAVNVTARRHVRNEPKQWLEAMTWDGESRLSELLPTGFGSERDEYTQRIGECFLIGMVARIYKPGCKVDTLPVFEGQQGAFKSQALGVIGGAWFAECHESMTHKDFYGVIQGKILVEISELHAFTRSEIERVKGVITCQVDRYRSAYDRRTADHPRQGVFAGTTNRDDWNRDETGARRFWPIKCGNIRLEWLAEHREQLFAEATERYKAGEDWWMIPTELAAAEQAARRPEEPWTEPVRRWLEANAFQMARVDTQQIMTAALGISLDKLDRAQATRVGVIMRDMEGWAKRRVRVNGARVWVYDRTERLDNGTVVWCRLDPTS